VVVEPTREQLEQSARHGAERAARRGSGILYGVAADAARVAQHIAADARGGRAASYTEALGAPASRRPVPAAGA